MQIHGRTAILTGASRGLGPHLARRLAREGARLVLAARSPAGLEAVRAQVQQLGADVHAVATDLRDPRALERLISQALERFGTIDLLVNNAGIDSYAPFHERTAAEIDEQVQVNLVAPLQLARLALVPMVRQNRGHVVFMSSLAGKFGLPYGEVYAATKAGLILFSSSLRTSYRGTGISASVIVPGYVEDGMYARLRRLTGIVAPPRGGTSPPEAVAAALVRAVERDVPEIIVSPRPCRPLLAAAALYPGLLERVMRTSAGGLFHRSAELRVEPAPSDQAT